jgi:RNA polymerase sigma factor (sigma-70 family)
MAARARLAPESWDDLFDFLDPKHHDATGPDRDREAEAKCVEIMRKLVCFFASRHCANAEDLAMETILRVAAKCREVDVSNYNDRLGYFYAVARNLVYETRRESLRESTRRESMRQELVRQPIPDPEAWTRKEAVHRCLELCMSKLAPRARQLIVQYHQEGGTAKIASHQMLADEFGKSRNALRIEVYRIRKTLQQCVFGCLRPESNRGDFTTQRLPD